MVPTLIYYFTFFQVLIWCLSDFISNKSWSQDTFQHLERTEERKRRVRVRKHNGEVPGTAGGRKLLTANEKYAKVKLSWAKLLSLSLLTKPSWLEVS